MAAADCWVGQQRTSEGKIQPDASRFPRGLQPVIEHVHSLGLRFGLYTSVGDTTCNNHGHPVGTWPRGGSYGHYKEDTETFASWGVDYLKVTSRATSVPPHSNPLLSQDRLLRRARLH